MYGQSFLCGVAVERSTADPVFFYGSEQGRNVVMCIGAVRGDTEV